MLALLCQLGAAGVLGTHDRKDVFDPPVLYPHAGTVWYKGQRHNVTWDVSDPPPYIINPVGRIFLRKGELILETNFDIMLGRIQVTVPWVLPDHDYSLILLYGDSGNFG
ncbi:hypothetical protein L227DRAFT_593704 [Lentinus tigrinus ALCF2SS1-6]|uniref:Uncharacterized protein n=1 Tax=Lentinus tigrinus ALCF2SS1-6 TaxID=1328759 RepID=A0A5C2SF15_9APHY|nr:hypothetical protein L227DRAFT_593704 [Lentinus tigrinus ALCF2SS1-6]